MGLLSVASPLSGVSLGVLTCIVHLVIPALRTRQLYTVMSSLDLRLTVPEWH